MPMYLYKDLVSGTQVEVLRKFSEYDQPPTEEEAPGLVAPKWERLIGGKQTIQKGMGWGSKGNW